MGPGDQLSLTAAGVHMETGRRSEDSDDLSHVTVPLCSYQLFRLFQLLKIIPITHIQILYPNLSQLLWLFPIVLIILVLINYSDYFSYSHVFPFLIIPFISTWQITWIIQIIHIQPKYSDYSDYSHYLFSDEVCYLLALSQFLQLFSLFSSCAFTGS